jgi:hypothetical protein
MRGGRQTTHPARAAQAVRSRSDSFAARGPWMPVRTSVPTDRTVSGPLAVDRSRRPRLREGSEKSVHRGSHGASLKHRARDAEGFSGLAVLPIRIASKWRDIEARGSTGAPASRASLTPFEERTRNDASPGPLYLAVQRWLRSLLDIPDASLRRSGIQCHTTVGAHSPGFRAQRFALSRNDGGVE